MSTTLSEREEIEAKLDRYYKLVNLSVEGVLIHHAGVCVDVNVAMERLFGYDREELIGKEVLFLVAPEHRDIVVRNIAKSGSKPYEVLGLRKGGKRIPVLVEAYETEWEGKPIRVATMRDVSSRKQEENAMLEHLMKEQSKKSAKHVERKGDLMRLLAMRYMKEIRKAQTVIYQQQSMNLRMLESFPGIFYLYKMDAVPKLIKWNQNTESILEYSAVELFEMNVLRFFDENDHPKVLDAIQRLSKNGDTMLEANLVSKSGDKKPFLFTTRKYVEEGTDYFLGFGTDILKRKTAEHELERYSEKLEYLVHERTQALISTNDELALKNDALLEKQHELKVTLQELRTAQQELVHSDKMASIGLLTAGVAHEINNPLNFIQAGIYSLKNIMIYKDHEQESLVRQVIEHMQLGVERVSGIVTSLNHFSRRNDQKKEACVLRNIIDNCLLILKHETKDRCEIILDIIDGPLFILGNGGGLHQVFLNLILNAVQAIENQGTIRINGFTDAYNIIRIVIEDDGVGIPEEHLEKIYDPFFTTKEPGKGTGLGLSIVYQIVTDHGGSIHFSRVSSGGTRVNLSFPAHNQKP